MPTVTSLNNYSFAFNGFVFGGAGSPYQILSVDGLESLPELRVQDDNRGYNDGMFSGRDFYSARTISIILNIFSSTGQSAFQNYNTFQNNLLPQQSGTTVLQFQLSNANSLQLVYGRVRKLRATIDPEYTYGYIRAQLEIFCPDPKYYDNTLQTGSMVVSNPLGRTYNRIYPLVYGGGSSAVTTPVNNAGWTTTYPTVTINGPITNPTVGNTTTGNYITISGTYSNTDSVVLDLDNKLITVNGASARNLMQGSSTWFGAPPGTSQFYLTGTATLAGTTAAIVTWRNAYV
jgi:hypothetical protein